MLLLAIKHVFGGQLPGFIVVDTFARSMVGGDENSVKDVSKVIASTQRLQEITEGTVMFLHHGTKSKGEIRGSSALLGGLDTAMKTERNNSNKGNVVTLTCEKQKDAAEFEAITLIRQKVDLEDGESSLVFDITVPLDMKTRRQLEQLQILVHHAGEQGLMNAEWKRLVEEAGIKHTSFYKYKAALEDGGLVAPPDCGTKVRCQPTPAGINAMRSLGVKNPRVQVACA